MNKKRLIATAVFLMVTITAGTVLAEDSVKLIINGKEVQPSSPLLVVENRVMAPVRQIAEELGATVNWDEAKKTVTVYKDDTDKRLEMLEFALVSGTPEDIANTWARAFMMRNGAAQYAVMSDELKNKYKSDMESWNWMPGASSPWADSYEIAAKEKQPDGTWKFTFRYHYTDSAKTSYDRTSGITVGKKNVEKAPVPIHSDNEQKWYVIAIEQK